jgi:hypothetical protein
MPVDKSYRMKILESRKVIKTEPRPSEVSKAPAKPSTHQKIVESKEILKRERRPARVRKVQVKPSTQQIVRAFKKAPGYDEIVERIPKAATARGWDQGTQVAYFSVCSKTGTASFLDIWDCDHFDGFTDMQRSVSDCRAWFSHMGFTTWGSPQTATGRINCFFNAASAGDYACVAQLQSYPTSSGATVECLIDNNSFGPLPFTGSIPQPHFSVLSAGGHHFRIRQMNGSFFFLSLTVYKF